MRRTTFDTSEITQILTTCTVCPHTGGFCQQGYALLQKLREAIRAAGDSVGEDFELNGQVQISSCKQPCTARYRATRDGAEFYGDLSDTAAEDEDLGRLAANAGCVMVLEDTATRLN